MKFVATRQDENIKEMFVADMIWYNANKLVFIDETGMNTRDSMRKYG